MCVCVWKREINGGKLKIWKPVIKITCYIQYLVITCNGKECKKEYIYLYTHIYMWITLPYTWN